VSLVLLFSSQRESIVSPKPDYLCYLSAVGLLPVAATPMMLRDRSGSKTSTA
jgi:hypothetical protein